METVTPDIGDSKMQDQPEPVVDDYTLDPQPTLWVSPAAKRCDEVVKTVARQMEGKLERVRSQIVAAAKPFYTVDDVARITSRGVGTVKRWISKGMLDAVHVDEKGPYGGLQIPGTEMAKLVCGGLGIYVPPEVLEEEFGPLES
jgi:hypothetical protein